MNMLFSEMIEAVSTNHLARQLLYLKRCFGGRADLGIVVAGGEVDFCDTMAKLTAHDHIPTGLEWLDQFLLKIPKISEMPEGDFTVVSSRHPDGPPCPWNITLREQEAARARGRERRLKKMLNGDNKMTTTFTGEKNNGALFKHLCVGQRFRLNGCEYVTTGDVTTKIGNWTIGYNCIKLTESCDEMTPPLLTAEFMHPDTLVVV